MMIFLMLKTVFLAFVVNFCVNTTSFQKFKFVFNDESDTSKFSFDEFNDSTDDDNDDFNEDDNSKHNDSHDKMKNDISISSQIKS